MSHYEVAVYIVGYRRRVNELLRNEGQASYWNLIPNLKDGALPRSLGLLPDEDEEKKEEADKAAILQALKERWGD